ncbi:hypothetical protein GALL_521010 [mine drainage metagenome]|uniref:Uncharacterized protein n=1 Tax=mine drainage metagenome TaxID=410659 RepID=A0A1J5PFL4_9ZZZZ
MSGPCCWGRGCGYCRGWSKASHGDERCRHDRLERDLVAALVLDATLGVCAARRTGDSRAVAAGAGAATAFRVVGLCRRRLAALRHPPTHGPRRMECDGFRPGAVAAPGLRRSRAAPALACRSRWIITGSSRGGDGAARRRSANRAGRRRHQPAGTGAAVAGRAVAALAGRAAGAPRLWRAVEHVADGRCTTPAADR